MLEVAVERSAKTRLHSNGVDPDFIDDGGNSDLKKEKNMFKLQRTS